MIAYRLASAALADAMETAAYYERAEPGLGREFYEALDSAINRIRNFPKLGRPRGTRLRSHSLTKFPSDVIYHLQDDCIIVVAVAHQSRLPDFWQDRTL